MQSLTLCCSFLSEGQAQRRLACCFPSLNFVRVNSTSFGIIFYLAFFNWCLAFLAFFNWAFDCGRGLTRFRCQEFRARSDSCMICSTLSSTWSDRWSSIISRGVADTPRLLTIRKICSGWTCLARCLLREALWVTGHSESQSTSGANILPLLVSWQVVSEGVLRLSMCETNPVSRPTIEASHLTQWAFKICCVLLA